MGIYRYAQTDFGIVLKADPENSSTCLARYKAITRLWSTKAITPLWEKARYPRQHPWKTDVHPNKMLPLVLTHPPIPIDSISPFSVKIWYLRYHHLVPWLNNPPQRCRSDWESSSHFRNVSWQLFENVKNHRPVPLGDDRWWYTPL